MNAARPWLLITFMLFGCVLAADLPVHAAPAPWTMRVYFGTYTRGKSKGIYSATFDPASGQLGAAVLAAEATNPSFLALHPNKHILYAANELGNFQNTPAGSLSAFSIGQETGALSLLNQQSSGGADPCHLAVDASGRCLLAANYTGGSVISLPLASDSRIAGPGVIVVHHGSSVNLSRQAGPHAHFITPDPANRWALACDLGLDKVLIYHLDPAASALLPNDPSAVSLAPGSGPRHLAFHPSGRWVFVVNELNSTLTEFAFDREAGRLRQVKSLSTLPDGFLGQNSCAEVQVHPRGNFVYASNRGHDSLAIFSIDPESGNMSFRGCQPTQGKTPRHFAVDPSGRWLLAENQDSDNVVVFGIDRSTGQLAATGQVVEVGSPVCAVFVP